jgi:hypothetical protein
MTLISLASLAAAYRDAGRYADAIPLYERTLASYEQQFGPDYPSTAATRDNLAAVRREAAAAG